MTQQTMERIASCSEKVSDLFEREGLTLRVLTLRAVGRGGGSGGEGQGKLYTRRGKEVTLNATARWARKQALKHGAHGAHGGQPVLGPN